MKKTTKKIGIIIITVLIAILILIGIFSYIKYSKNNVHEDNKYETIDVNDKEVTELFECTRSDNTTLFNGTEYENLYYVNDKVIIKEQEESFKLMLSYVNLTIDNYKFQDDGTVEISGKAIKSNYEKLFGKGDYKPSSINYSCPSVVQYDKSKDIYYYSEACGMETLNGYINKLIEARKYKDKIEIYEKVAFYFVDSENNQIIYTKNSNYSDYLTSTSYDGEFDINNYLDNLKTYKYTFVYKDGNYYFDSVQLMNKN